MTGDGAVVAEWRGVMTRIWAVFLRVEERADLQMGTIEARGGHSQSRLTLSAAIRVSADRAVSALARHGRILAVHA